MKANKTTFVFLLVVSIFDNLQWASPIAESAQILGLFPHPGKSHFEVFRPLLKGLSAAGHNLTVVSYFPNTEPITNYTDLQLTGTEKLVNFVDLAKEGAGSYSIRATLGNVWLLYKWGINSCKIVLESDILETILKSSITYDVIITEVFNNDCMLAIAHLLQVPVVGLSSCYLMPWHHHRLGSPFIPSFMPNHFLFLNDNMSFGERIINSFFTYTTRLFYNFHTQRKTDALIRDRFGHNIPPINVLAKNISVLLINQHYSLNGVYPYTPRIVEVGGFYLEETKSLEPNLKKLLDNSVKGVIYISWGSMVRLETIPPEMKAALINTINRYPEYTFLMKWPNETIRNKPGNLYTRPWMPQRDLLCHPKVKAFLSHGGLGGLTEAVKCGVPLLLTPLFGDQFINVKAAERSKLGVIVEYRNFNEESITAALRTILQPSFVGTVKHISEGYNHRPQKPMDLAIWWVEHIIQTKGAAIPKSASADLNWFVYNSIDVYLIFVVFLLVVYEVAKKIILLSFSACMQLRNGSENKSKVKFQ